jgi:hypothetical protein
MVNYDIDVLTEICWLYTSSVFILEEMTLDFHWTRGSVKYCFPQMSGRTENECMTQVIMPLIVY